MLQADYFAKIFNIRACCTKRLVLPIEVSVCV